MTIKLCAADFKESGVSHTRTGPLPREKAIEAALCANHEPLLESIFGDYSGPSIVHRQVQLPCGTADIVLQHSYGLTVVEVKRHLIDDAAIGQCLRYVGALRRMALVSPYRVCVTGIVAAPSITHAGRYALRASSSLSYCKIDIETLAIDIADSGYLAEPLVGEPLSYRFLPNAEAVQWRRATRG